MSVRSKLFAAALSCLALAAARPAAAVSVIEPLAYGSWRTEPETFSLGGGAAFGLAGFDIVPTFEYVWVDNATDWAFNLDGHIPVLPLPIVALYAGAGYANYHHDPKVGGSTDESGFNVLVGAKASVLFLKPFGEIKYTTAGRDGMILTLGSRINLFK